MTGFRMAALAAAFIATAATPALAQQSRPGAASPQTPSAPGAALQQDDLSDAMVHKVGAALRQTVTIRQKFAERAQATKSQEQQEALTAQAQTEMMQAISDQGLSIQQYNQVIQMAQADPTLKQRVLSAAQSGG